MAINNETLAAAMGFTKATVEGVGALAGKPCQIQSITDITGGKRVTFLWVDNSDVEHTSTMDVMNGEKGADGNDYVLTNQDKQDIANIVLSELPEAESEVV